MTSTRLVHLSMISSSLRRLSQLSSHMNSTQSPKVVLTRNLGPDVMPLLESRNDIELVQWTEDRACDRKWLLENVRGATAVIVMVTDKVDAELMDAAGPQLRVISTMSVGFDHVDTKEISKRKLKLGYTPDVLSDAVADICIMLALMAGRNARECMAVVNEGRWPQYSWSPFLFCGRQLSSTSGSKRTVGFIGFGRIAQATLARLIPFGYSHCLYLSNPSSPPNPERDSAIAAKHKLKAVRRVDAPTLAAESDVVFVLAPGGAETQNVVNEQFLRHMKKTAVLVNASRGTLVDSDALAKALKEQWIWGAGLDVVAGEPNINEEHVLVKEPRCAILPHIGSGTFETRVDMATLAVNNALAVILGIEMPVSMNFD